jgi:acyl-coenzyme A thioesterase PaaI-like protein
MTSTSAWATSSFIELSRALPLPKAEIAHFSSIPSLRQWFTNPVYSPIGTATRIARADGENDFFAITLQTPNTIPHWLLLVHNERVASLPFGPNGAAASTKLPVPSDASAESPDMLLLLSLGRGTNGFKAVAHGGLLSALFDEALSYSAEFARQARTTCRNGLFTANLTLDFKRPVITATDGVGDGVVVVKCWTTRVEGRKYWLEAVIENVQGKACVAAKGLWIEARDGAL